MRKEGLLPILLLVLLLSVSLVSSDEASDVAKAYQCLQNKITAKGCAGMTVEEKAFSLLALKDFEICKNELKTNPGTTIKEKALALLALKSVGENATALENSLISQKMIPPGINWYLQVETGEAASCEVFYDNSAKSFSIGTDRKLSGNPGNCLSLAKNNSWFLISASCQDKIFEVSCDNDKGFLTNLLYQEQGSSTIFVSAKTHTSPKSGVTQEKINSYCLKQGTTCSYEGTLWASVALDYPANRDIINAFIPYLMAKASSNPQLFPESFLYYLTELPEYKATIFAKQGKFSNNKFWSVSGDKAYDTALALYPFQNQEFEQKTDARESILKLRDSNGCWSENVAGTIRNTAFLLHSLWPDLAPLPPEPPECSSTDPCPSGYVCNQNGQCIVQQVECTSNPDCVAAHGEGWACNLTTSTCFQQGSSCQGDSQCTTENQPRCVAGSCKECTNATESTDCGPNQRCIENACQNRPGAPYCGDGNIDQGEQCDLTNLGAATCTLGGFNNGTVACSSSCTLNYSGCFNTPIDECNNSTKPCTNSSQTCVNNHCVPQTSTNQSVCGNGILESGEECDGISWREGINDCTDFYFDLGNVSCNPAGSASACFFNTSLCHDQGAECTVDANCTSKYGTGYECISGTCFPPIDDICDFNSDCDDGEKCEYGDCVPIGGGTDELPDCETDFQYFCRSSNACLDDNGEVLTQYACDTPLKCCSVDTTSKTCGDYYGEICNSQQKCSGGTEITDASDLSLGESCCVGGSCQDKTDDVSDCQWYGGTCKTSCGSGETQNSDECSSVYGEGYVCCTSSGTTPPSSKPSYTWLWVLLILVLFAVGGILFRDKLRILFMKLRSKFGKDTGPRGPPGFPRMPPSPTMGGRPILRRIMPPQQPIRPSPQAGRPPSAGMPPARPAPQKLPAPKPASAPEAKKTEKPKPKSDLDDVLKKLKDMGK